MLLHYFVTVFSTEQSTIWEQNTSVLFIPENANLIFMEEKGQQRLQLLPHNNILQGKKRTTNIILGA